MMIRHGGGPRGGVARSVKKMRGYLAELIHRKRENPGDDLISGLIRASDHGEHLTENEAAAMAFILLFAGFETTVNLIGNGVYALLRNPEQRERLQRSLDAGRPGCWRPASRNCCGTTVRWSWRPGGSPPNRWCSAAGGSRRATPYWWCSPPRTGILNGSPTPTPSTSPGVTISTSATGTASTTVWGRRWPDWRDRPRWPRC